MVGTAMTVGDSVATMYITFYLRFISSDMHILLWIGLGLNVVSVVGTSFLIESPAWLVTVGEQEWVQNSLRFVARINGNPDFKVGTVLPNKQAEAESEETEMV